MTFFSDYPNIFQELVFSHTDVDGLEKIIKAHDERQAKLALQELFSRKDKLALQAQRRHLRKWIAKPEIALLTEERVLKGAIQIDGNILAGKAGLSFEDKYLRLEYLVMRQLKLSCNYGNLVEYAPLVLIKEYSSDLSLLLNAKEYILNILPLLSTKQLMGVSSHFSGNEVLMVDEEDKISRLPYSMITKGLKKLFDAENLDIVLIKSLIDRLPLKIAQKMIEELYRLLIRSTEPKKVDSAIDYLGDYFSPIQLKKLAEALFFTKKYWHFRKSLEKVIRLFPDWRQQIIEEALNKIKKNKKIDQKSLSILYHCCNFLSNFDWILVILQNNIHNLEQNIRDLNVFFQYLSDKDANSVMRLCLDEFKKPNASKTDLIRAMNDLAPYISNLQLIDECLECTFLDANNPGWDNICKRAVDCENVEQRIDQALDILKNVNSNHINVATSLLPKLSSKMTVQQLQKFKELLLSELRKSRPNDRILYLLQYIPLSFESHEKAELSRIFNQSVFTTIDSLTDFTMRVAPILSSDDIANFFEKFYQFRDLHSYHFKIGFNALVSRMEPSELVIKVSELLTHEKNAINRRFLKSAIAKLSIDLCTDALISEIFNYYAKKSKNVYWLAQKFSGRIPATIAYAILAKHQYDNFKAMDILLKGLNAGSYEQLIKSFIEKYQNRITDSRNRRYQRHFIVKLLPHLSATQAASILAFAPSEVLFEKYNPCIAERLLALISTEEKDKIIKSYIVGISYHQANNSVVKLEIITNHLMQVTNKVLTNKEKETFKEILAFIVGAKSCVTEFIKLKAFASLCLTFLLKRKVLAKEETPLLLIDCLNNTEFTSLISDYGKLFCTLECDSSMNADILSRFIEKQLGIPIIENPHLNRRGKWEFHLPSESERYIGFTPDLLKKSIYQSINRQLNGKTRSAYEAIFNKETNLTGKEKLLHYFKAFLSDYTKGDAWYSGVVRLFHGHANRHHVEMISRIINRIDKKEINDPLQLLETLEKEFVCHINLGGSLTRRKAFMWGKYNDYLEQLNPVVNDSQKEYSRQSYVC